MRNGRCYQMNENNVNPNPVDDVKEENTEPLTEEVNEVAEESVQEAEVVQTEAEVQETEAAEAEIADETEETVDDTAEESADVAETTETEKSEDDEAAEEVETAEEPVKKKKRRGVKALIAFLVLVMVIAIAGMIAVIYTAEKSKIDLDQVVLTVDNVDSNAAEFYQSYMYYYSYNSYYQYSEEQLKELAVDQLLLTNSLYADAIAAGYTVTDELQQQIDEQLESIKLTAESSSITADEYLNKAFCPGFTLEMFEEILTKSMVAQKYYSDKMETIEKKYEGDSGKTLIEAEYNENKLSYDLTDVSYWYFDASEEGAQDNADAIVAQVNGGKSFDAAIQSVTGDKEALSNALKGHSKSALESGSFIKAAIEWIFAENEDGSYKNAAGAVTTVADDSKIYVFYVNNAPHRDEIYPVDVEYIQVDVSTDSSIKTEKELKIEAKSVANSVMAEFEDTDKTVESFKKIVVEKNNGDDKLVKGDVFELMKNDGSVDAVVEEWAFEDGRAVGDYALVESEDCYYILFFANRAENPVWYDSIWNAMVTNEARAFEEGILAESEASAQINDDVVNDVIAYVANLASQYSY